MFAVFTVVVVVGLLLTANASQIGRGRTGLVCKLLPRTWLNRGGWLVASDAAWFIRLLGAALVVAGLIPIFRYYLG